MAIQFTLPLVILALAGMALTVWRQFSKSATNGIIIIVLLWFFLPLFMVIIFTPTMYDNFRQFLFITPPLFVFAALSFEKITASIKNRSVSVVVGILLLLPGFISGIWLHPYEYIYYNALVGWTGSIARDYETDYWGTSMCEAAHYLAVNAKEGSQIAFTDSTLSQIFIECSKKNFTVIEEKANEPPVFADYYVVLVNSNDWTLEYFKSLKNSKIILRGNTPFAVIYSK